MADIQISQNTMGNTRTLLVDPSINITLPYTQTGTGIGSFTTTGGGGTAPANLRFIFLSSVGEALPSLSGITFDTIWNTADGALPAGWPSSWKSEAADLKIRRVDLLGVLVRLVLNNVDANNDGTWKIDSASSTLTLPACTQKIAWYFDGSNVSLYDSGGSLIGTEVLHNDTSYSYEWAQWRRHLESNGQGPTSGMNQVADNFLAAGVSSASTRYGADPQAVADEMFNYLKAYTYWAQSSFYVGSNSVVTLGPELRQLNDAYVRLTNFTANLIK